MLHAWLVGVAGIAGASGGRLKLVLFDVDGTLTLGEGLGTRCFFGAFTSTFGIRPHSENLSSFRESTDSGIATEVFERALGRAPRVSEVAALRAGYLHALHEILKSRPGCYRPVSGAREALDGALEEAGWTVALATGNWSGAASAKLASAAIREPRLGGFADDAHTRVGILTAAISACGADRDSKVVYVGDRPWDATAAAEAGIGFVGVGECMANGQDARTSGASVLADLADFSRLLGALEEQAKTVGRFT